jgi:hypothetical protein
MRQYFDLKNGSLSETAQKIREKALEKEGNMFTKALMAARENGNKFFTVNGKEYKTENLDKVNPVAVKKKFDDRKDKDIDNDGDVDSTDKYLHKRRKAISKAIAKEDPSHSVVIKSQKKKIKEETISEIQNNKNLSMREALAKIWNADAGKNYFEAISPAQQAAIAISKKERGEKPKEEEVKYPHKMYDPKSGKEVDAKTPEDHEKYAKMGYTHTKPVEEKTLTGKKETKVEINPKV